MKLPTRPRRYRYLKCTVVIIPGSVSASPFAVSLFHVVTMHKSLRTARDMQGTGINVPIEWEDVRYSTVPQDEVWIQSNEKDNQVAMHSVWVTLSRPFTVEPDLTRPRARVDGTCSQKSYSKACRRVKRSEETLTRALENYWS